MKITDLHSLRLEKERLRILSGLKEQELKQSAAYIRENTGSILWRYINPLSMDGLKDNILPIVSGLVVGGGKMNPKAIGIKAVKYLLMNYGVKWGRALLEKRKTKTDYRDDVR